MRNKYLLTFLLVAFYLIISIQAFAAKITGVVTDAADSSVLSGVTVFLKNTDKGTQTDADGYFEIDNVEDGTYEILFSLMTYKKALQTITITKDKDVVVNLQLKEDGKNLKEVTVKSARVTNTENAVMMEMRKSNQIVSGISSQQIQKTMDRNAADVVKRVPGVTIRDDQFIMVRGLNDRYNNVWLNDVGAPSSEVDRKSFSFDIIPSGQIDRILVYKTPAPELPGDFAGGMVKLYTTSIPDKNTYTAGVQVSSREYSTGTDFNYNKRSSTDWLGYDDGMRSLPDNLPEYVTKNDPDNAAVTKSFKNNWPIETKKLSPDLRFNGSASNIIKLGGVKIGNTFSVSYSNTSTNFAVNRYEWDSISPVNHFQDRLSVNNVTAALMDNLAVAWGNNKIEFKNLYNQLGKSNLTVRSNTPDSIRQDGNERTYVMGYESRAAYSSQLGGTHKSSDDTRKYTWTLGYTDLFKNMPDLKRISYSKAPDAEDSLYMAPIGAAAETVYGGGRIFSQLYEKTYSFNHQYTQKINLIKEYEFEVSLGNYIEQKNRAFMLRQFAYTIQPGATAFNLKRLPVNQIFDEGNTGGKGLFNIEEATNPYDKYNAKNLLVASFIAVKLPALNNDMTIYGGVRHEYNKYTLVANKNLTEAKADIITEYFLPSLNVSYNINAKHLVRAAYGKTLNRPEFRENSPFYFYDLESRWGVFGAMFGSNTNTQAGDTLDVAQIQNIDARWEWYPSASEVIQAGVFYKYIKTPIQQVIDIPDGPSRAYTVTNMKEGYTYGLEVDVRKNLSFIGSKFFNNLSFIGNLALIKSEVTPDTNVKNIKTPLQGQSPYMYNAGLYYQNDSIGLQLTAVYNVFGPRIYVLGKTDDGVGNIWEMPFHSLDIILSKSILKHFTLTAGVQNLLNQSVRQFQDADYDNKINTKYEADAAVNDRPILSYKPGRYFTIGLKMRF